MKRCPTCQRTYPDDAPAFCVNDGTKLVTGESSSSYDPQKTILSSATPTPPQYSSPQPPSIKPPTQQPPLQQQPPPQQPMWPPPPQAQAPQAQNWAGGYYPQGQAYAPVKSKGLSLTTFIVGAVSGILGGLLFIDYVSGAFRFSRDVAYPLLIGAIATGVIAIILGIISLISSRQSGKALAAIGLILGAASVGFWIYLEVDRGIFFR
jgi:hypothetical protein